jgi:hypothetical protein
MGDEGGVELGKKHGGWIPSFVKGRWRREIDVFHDETWRWRQVTSILRNCSRMIVHNGTKMA